MDRDRNILSLPNKATSTIEAPALLIDVCGAVFDDSHWRRWLYQLLLKMGLHTNYVAFYRLWDQEYLPQVKRGQASFGQTLQAFLISAGLTSAQAAEVWVAVSARKRALERGVCPMPGVAATLRNLKASGFRLAALVSNPVVEQQLGELSLKSSFEKVYRGSEIARASGEEHEYRAALAKWASGSADGIALVSQDPWELDRAAAAGLQAIAVNYDGAVVADAHLEHLGEISGVVTLPQARRLAG